ncbi:phosphomevalonate decarboxylase MvaD [Halococcoides cellulosivorans]|uniref:Diphosphomevalonate decarboxylase n=1 Tax=Halococcoides cellulosivorans TaxID=1679096 RepID=A0A2R4WYS9_9EURY|nr:phosphomevalonate decarboxylase MvaD [Halococcoides cellulosivorans]AWB26682.1 diphosphomevalonate decarboxylase [Halococcoides cellulosivorans]
MKATARAHPIQGLVKYHGLREKPGRYPYHDSISVCTAPAATTTTVAFEDRDADRYAIGGDPVEGRGAERIRTVVDAVRERAGIDRRVRMESENSFPSNVGFGSSASGFAALATALVAAADLDLSRPGISAIARRGSASAARAVTGGVSLLEAGLNDQDCRSHRLESAVEDWRVVGVEIPVYKETDDAHEEAAASPMFEARRAQVGDQIAEMKDALRAGTFDRVADTAERDTLALAATTMTGPSGWVYWDGRSIEVFEAVRELRSEEDIPAYFSTDTGASVYVNTTADAVDRVQDRLAGIGTDTHVWSVGGPASIVDDALF